MPKLTKIIKNQYFRIAVKRNLLVAILLIVSFSSLFAQTKEDYFGKLRTVVIDAGHGGKDKGCLGSKGYEKDVALSISLKLGAYLEKTYPDLNVIYTRKTDVFVELQDRAKIANKAKADLFICIHANAGNSAAYGTETYVMGDASSEANMRAAQRENSVILMEEDYETKYGNFDPNSPESYIILSFTQKAHKGQSLAFAAKVQDQFRERVGRKDRGVKEAGFLVLHQTTMPSVLIETGFLTNRNEEKFLLSEDGQDYLASAIYRAFKEYKKEIESVSESLIEENIQEEIVEKKEKETTSKEEPKQEGKEGVAKKEEEKSKVPDWPQGKRNDAEGLYFAVQLATSSKKIDTKAANFKGLENVEMHEVGDLFRYTLGRENSWNDANELQEKAREKGYSDAFVVAFHNGKRIAVGEAVKLLKRDN